jgi:hypothetical protein
VRVLHIHDNNGATDTHSIPFSQAHSTCGVDWEDAAEGLRLCGFLSAPGRCLNLELKTSDLPADPTIRHTHAAHAIRAARQLAGMI